MGIHPDFVFRTYDPAVVESVQSSVNRHERWRHKVAGYAELITGKRDYVTTTWLGVESLLGFPIGPDDEVPRGWRRSSSDERYIVPDQRHHAGKVAAKELRELPGSHTMILPHVPGMPESVRVNRRNRYPEYSLVDTPTGVAVEVIWFTQHSMRDPYPIPVVADSRWESVPLAEWLSDTKNLEKILHG